MRRQLIIVRHAKSAWDDPLLEDHARPLAPRGRAALPKLADHLGQLGLTPDVVLCSSAVRTLATLEGLRAVLPATAEVVVDARLYHADEHWIMGRVQSLDDENVRSAMVIGHNPGAHRLARLLVGDGRAIERRQLESKFPTAAAATISFEGRWEAVAPGRGRLDALFLPRRPRP